MGNLSSITTLGRVDERIEAEAAKEPPRDYLGMSEVGDPCLRRLWLKAHTSFRENFSARKLRIFGMGHIIEARVVRDLRLAGCKVNRGKRANTYTDLDGRFRGHSDGIISGIEESTKRHILEVKSANDKRFQTMRKNGMESEPVYMAQAQLYMGYAKLERALFVVENKSDSERISERVKFDRDIFFRLREKARMILDAKTPPMGINESPMWWECKLCPLNNDLWCRRDWEIKREGVPF